MKPAKKKRLYFEDVKTRHTTHWDLDYLSLVELDSMYGQKSREEGAGDRKRKWSRPKILAAVLVGASTVLLAALLVLLLNS